MIISGLSFESFGFAVKIIRYAEVFYSIYYRGVYENDEILCRVMEMKANRLFFFRKVRRFCIFMTQRGEKAIFLYKYFVFKKILYIFAADYVNSL